MQQLDTVRPSVVIPQFLMPDADGLEICRTLRAARPRSELGILVTSFLSAEDWVLDAGADAFLQRPLSESRLVKALNRLYDSLHSPTGLSRRQGEEAATDTPTAATNVEGQTP